LHDQPETQAEYRWHPRGWRRTTDVYSVRRHWWCSRIQQYRECPRCRRL